MKPKTTLRLHDPHIPWHRAASDGAEPTALWGRGYASIDGAYREGQELVDHVMAACGGNDGALDADALKRLIPNLDGGWALVARWPDGRVLAATDRARSIPLFYAETPSEFVVGADGLDLRRHTGLTEIDEVSALEYLLAGYVTGDATLFQGIHQVRAGQVVEFAPADGAPRLERTMYYHFFPTERTSAPPERLEEQLESLIRGCFENLARGLRGRRVVVPLSGGLDSRLVVAMLKEQGIEDVLCFSYGQPGNEEAKVSRAVADALGYEWRFIEYSREVWAKWMDHPAMREYWRYCSKGVSLPHLQDFPATMALASEFTEGNRPLFFPGHSADMLAGSHIRHSYEKLQSGHKRVAQYILAHHYVFWDFRRRFKRTVLYSLLLEKIRQLTAAPGPDPKAKPVARCEMWNVAHRQALYIINSVRCYELIGMPWCTLWMYPLMDFFLRLPLSQRINKRLYITTLRDRIFQGALAPLAEIPVAGAGALHDPIPARPVRKPSERFYRMARRMAGRLLTASRLRHVAARFQKTPRPSPTFSDFCFGERCKGTSATLQKLLEDHSTLEKLPSTLLSLVEPHLRLPEKRVSFLARLSAITLGEVCAGTDANNV